MAMPILVRIGGLYINANLIETVSQPVGSRTCVIFRSGNSVRSAHDNRSEQDVVAAINKAVADSIAATTGAYFSELRESPVGNDLIDTASKAVRP